MQSAFYELADFVGGLLRKDEVFTCNFEGEESDFVRFNHGRFRQPGTVIQRKLTLRLIEGSRHAKAQINLSGVMEEDRSRLGALLGELRATLPHLPDDPHLLYSAEVNNSEQHGEDLLGDSRDICGQIVEAAADVDLIGIYAAGPVFAGFANSFGQRNWFSSHSFNFDWSLYHAADKAVKANYAGFAWDADAFDARLVAAKEQLAVLARPARTVDPGSYRVYLTPTALHEVIDLLGWGGFGMEAHQTKTTPFLHLVEGKQSLDSRISLSENTADGVAPNFEAAGFIKPERVSLVDRGSWNGCLVSPRSAKEYDTEPNGANAWEAPLSMDMGGGSLAPEGVLEELGTGVWVSNLWYLNYSDRAAGRMTGMTRFATFWVEGGKIAAPLNVMRFDESIYRMLGENLVDLTAQRDLVLDNGTYGKRSTASTRLPGALIDGFAFTL